MTKVIDYSDDLLGWKRESGPLRVWRVVDDRKNIIDKKTVRFSIQEIPKDRYDDVLDLMMSIFTRDEPVCRNMNVSDDPMAKEDFRKLWSFALQKGSVVGAFRIDENKTKPPLAGVNMTVVACETTEKTLLTGIEFPSVAAKKMLRFMHAIDTERNIREFYNVDKLITAYGLCVDPQYRGQGLGLELLRARREMSKAYGIKATSTVFTAPAAQKSAARAGFEVLVERNFGDIVDENGIEIFPGIPEKSVKLMGTKFYD